jgi:hypothetical protein
MIYKTPHNFYLCSFKKKPKGHEYRKPKVMNTESHLRLVTPYAFYRSGWILVSLYWGCHQPKVAFCIHDLWLSVFMTFGFFFTCDTTLTSINNSLCKLYVHVYVLKVRTTKTNVVSSNSAFRGTRVQHRFWVGFVLLDLYFYVYFL